jgi:hypothetical protein
VALTRRYVKGISLFFALPSYRETLLTFEKRFSTEEPFNELQKEKIKIAFCDGSALITLTMIKQEKAFGSGTLRRFLEKLPGISELTTPEHQEEKMFKALFNAYTEANERLGEPSLAYSLIRPGYSR